MQAASINRAGFRSIALASAVGVAMLLVVPAAVAVDHSFLPATGGDWNTAANWSTATVPGSADLAIFAANTDGTVTLSAASNSLGLAFRNTAGLLTIDGEGNALSVNTGTIFVGNTSLASQANNVTITDIAVASTASNSFSVGVANALSNALTFTGPGTTFTSTTTGGSTIGPANTSNNSLTVSNGAIVQTYNTINVGGTGVVAYANSLNNSLTVDGGQFRGLNGNRLLNLAAGTLTVSNGGVAIFGGGLDVDTGSGGNASAINFSSGRISGRNSTINFASDLPFTIGDGVVSGTNGRAQYEMSSSAPTITAADGVFINSDGTLAGSNVINGSISGVLGAQIRPTVFGLPGDSGDDKIYATLSVNGSHNNNGIDIGIDVGSVPDAIAADIPPFDPDTDLRVDRFLVNGAFTHGGTVTFDLATYVAPVSETFVTRILGWTAGADIGTSSLTAVSFANGNALPYEYRDDGIYLTLAPAFSEWAVDASGDWNLASNWNGVVPNAVDAPAQFGAAITAAQTVSTETPIIAGSVIFNNVNSYQIAGTGSLTLQASSGASQIDIQQGTHTIGVPLIFASDANVTAASGAALIVSGATTIQTGKTVTKTGALTVTGPLTLDSNAKLVLDSGPTSLKGAPTLLSGAKIDVQDNSLVIDFTGQSSPAATIQAQLTSGYNGGTWDGEGINTSAVATEKGLGWRVTPGVESITIRYTFKGDTNLDAIVNFDDLLSLAQSYGSSSGVWSNGDSDYNGLVNFDDLLALAQNYGLSLLGSDQLTQLDELAGHSFVNDWNLAQSLVVVPEPTTFAAVSLAGFLARRRR